MADPKLNFKVLNVAADSLEIEVKNATGEPLGQPLDIELHFPAHVVSAAIRKAIEDALINTQPKNMKSLAGVVTVGGGLSIWALKEELQKSAVITAVNYRDQSTGATLATPTKVAADAVVNFRIPLTPQTKPVQVAVSFKYKHGGRRDPWINGSFEFMTSGGTQWQPIVSLTVDRPNSTMLEPAKEVTISWSVSDGVSATLRGPLPGGHSQLTLSDDSNSNFRIDKGSLRIVATGPATYMLDAEVRPPQGGPNVQVIRTLLLDTASVDKFAYLDVQPRRVLPNGPVDVDWAVWGIQALKLRIEAENKGGRSVEFTLTEQDAFHTYYGTGIWSETARNYNERVTLVINNKDELKDDITVAQWEKIEPPPTYTGKPLGLAVATPNMALLTSDGLWIAQIGDDDRTSYKPKFRNVTSSTPRTWRALTAYQKGFVVVWQTPKYGLQVAQYNSAGTQQGAAIDLEFDMVLRQPGATVDVVAHGDRVYVVEEARLPAGSLRDVYSVRFGAGAGWQGEPLLSQLEEYELLPIAGGLYGLHRGAGQMLRFDMSTNREIQEAWKAASATKGRQSLVRHGLPVPCNNVLIVLDPRDISGPQLLALSEQVNVSDFDFGPDDENTKAPPQDLIYNPQRDEWTSCGQGLKVKPGAVAAYRDGASKRLWVLQPTGEMYTLMDASAQLFAPKYVDKFPPAVLPPALNAKRFFQIKNESGKMLKSKGNAPFSSGLNEFSSAGLADVDPPPRMPIDSGRSEMFTIQYNRTDPPPVKLHYLIEPEGSSGADAPLYFLEIVFSGPDLTSVSSVFKRFEIQNGHVLSVTPVLDTMVHYPAERPPHEERFLRNWRREHPREPDPERPIVIPPVNRFKEKANLVICNMFDHQLHVSRERFPFQQARDMRIDYSTESFTLESASPQNRLGQLRFDINFALPHGIEISSSALAPQTTLLRVDTSRTEGLGVTLSKLLKPGESLDVDYRVNNETHKTRAVATDGMYYVFQVGKK